MLAGVFLALAQWQRQSLVEATKRGLEKARANGVRLGGSKPRVPKKATKEKVKAILSLKEKGTGVTDIAKVVGLSRCTIYEILKREKAA
jgi:DNA invertase Pin-like site-specific DNA recombinase